MEKWKSNDVKCSTTVKLMKTLSYMKRNSDAQFYTDKVSSKKLLMHRIFHDSLTSEFLEAFYLVVVFDEKVLDYMMRWKKKTKWYFEKCTCLHDYNENMRKHYQWMKLVNVTVSFHVTWSAFLIFFFTTIIIS